LTFTYSAAVDTDLARVRLAINDTSATTDAGVKPDGTNFTDEELNALITAGGSWQRGVVLALTVLANAYAAKARSVRESDYAEDLKAIAGELRAQAQEWMKNIPGAWKGLISSGSSEGPVFFGTEQWGAEVEDQG